MSSGLFLFFEKVVQVGWAEGRTSGLYPIRESDVPERGGESGLYPVRGYDVRGEGLPCWFRKGKLQKKEKMDC